MSVFASRPPVRVAAVQMVSSSSRDENLGAMRHWVGEAAKAGASLVLLPEYFCLMGRRDQDKVLIAEPFSSESSRGPIQAALAETARQHGVWLIGGTVPIQSPDPARVFNAMLVFGPDGQCKARYDKLHLFSFRTESESYDETRSICPGASPVTCQTVAGRTALSVCYDIRFPEFYRATDRHEPPDLILVSAAFTATTGEAHWETLLRARAIENQCWLLASAQGGEHDNGRRTWGHSMLVDPWGRIVSERSTGEGLVMGNVDFGQMASLRLHLPALSHRVL